RKIIGESKRLTAIVKATNRLAGNVVQFPAGARVGIDVTKPASAHVPARNVGHSATGRYAQHMLLRPSALRIEHRRRPAVGIKRRARAEADAAAVVDDLQTGAAE